MGALYAGALGALQKYLDDHEAVDAQLAADTAAEHDRLAGELSETKADLVTANATVEQLRERVRELEAGQQPEEPPTPPAPSGMLTGTYEGHFSALTVKANIGQLPTAADTYKQAASDGTLGKLDLVKHKAEIDLGVTQIIDLDYRGSKAVSVADVAAGKADTAASRWLDDLAVLADYARSQGVGVWFSFVHEAIVHINQGNFAAAVPSTGQMADAWNRVMGLCRDHAPDAVRTYWFGGMEAKVTTSTGRVAGGVAHGDQLDPALIQATTFDPYRFASHSDTETPQQTFGSVVTALKARAWAQGKPWGLTEYGTDVRHGDANNAQWISQTLAYLRDEGASVAIYFDRQNGTKDYRITTGTQPLSLAAYKAALA